MKSHTIALFLFLLATPCSAVAAAPINNLENLNVPTNYDGTLFTLEEIQAVLIDGSSARGWSASLEKEGLLTASIVVRGKHFAKITIPFNQRTFSILYADSENLDYNAARGTIHRNYNKWVLKLSRTINQKFSQQLSANQKQGWDEQLAGARPSSTTSTGDVYSQLLTLGELRDKGVLTEEEFQAEKRKLLDQPE